MKISFLPLLFLVFLVLKLTGVIAWSWWIITAPLWGGFALVCVLVTLLFIFALAQVRKDLTSKERLLMRLRRGWK